MISVQPLKPAYLPCNFRHSANAPASAGVGFHFHSLDDAGAFVLLKPSGSREAIVTKRHVVNYLRENFDSWLEWANSDEIGLELKDNELLFVSATIKTSSWTVAAYQGSSYRKKEGRVTGQLGPVASANISVSISNHILPANHYRTGPYVHTPRAPPSHMITAAGEGDGGGISWASDPSSNQCLFIHYFKLRRRMWFFKDFKASAGPDNLPDGPHDPSMEAEAMTDGVPHLEFERDPAPGEASNVAVISDFCTRLKCLVLSQSYDPVTPLLDYILRVCTCLRGPIPYVVDKHHPAL